MEVHPHVVVAAGQGLREAVAVPGSEADQRRAETSGVRAEPGDRSAEALRDGVDLGVSISEPLHA